MRFTAFSFRENLGDKERITHYEYTEKIHPRHSSGHAKRLNTLWYRLI